MRYMRSRLQDQRGIAVITAILISMVVVTLGVTSVTLAIHSSDQSAYDRRRVQGIAAAEAGLNWYFSHMQSGAASQLSCGPITQTLGSSPVASFSATAVFYDEAGTTLWCPPTNGTPTAALITSTGTTSVAGAPERTMQSYVNLIPGEGGGMIDAAMFSDEGMSFGSKVIINGSGLDNGTIYTNGSAKIKAFSQINGDVWAQGTIEMDANSQVSRSLWAKGEIKQGAHASVFGSETSATSKVHLSAHAHTYGDAQAATTIAVDNNGSIDGLQIPNTPSAAPPFHAFPTYTFNAADWQAEGYTVTTFTSCASAKSFIEGITGGDHAVRIAANCQLAWPSHATINVRGNLAIISNDGLSLGAHANFTNVGSPHTLHLIFGLVKCGEITLNADASIGPGITSLLYSTCEVKVKAESFVINGQVIAGKVAFDREATLNYTPVGVPGFGSTNFDEDVVYIREVANPA